MKRITEAHDGVVVVTMVTVNEGVEINVPVTLMRRRMKAKLV